MTCPICDDRKAWRGGSCKRCRFWMWLCYATGAAFVLWLLSNLTAWGAA